MGVSSDADIIKSYLVSLGATTDMKSFVQMDTVLKNSEFRLLSYQIATTAAFATAGFAVIGFIDKLAMADQKTKMLASQNMMGVQQYRAVASALDIMGMSLDDVFFGTKQVQQQFHTLIDDQKSLAAMVGPDYEKQMEMVRDVHFQLQRLELKGQYFGMKFATDLLRKLGFGEDGIGKQLERLNDWVLVQMPKWSDELSDDIIPVLKDFWGIGKDTVHVLWDLATVFTNVVGVIAGDDSLQKETVGFHDMARAVEDVVRWLGEMVHLMLVAEKVTVGLAQAIFHGLKERKMPDFTQHQRKDGTTYFDLWGTGGEDDKFGRMIDGIDKSKLDYGNVESPTKTLEGFLSGKAQPAAGMPAQALQAAEKVSKDTGIPASLIYGQWGVETNGFRHIAAENNLAGIQYPGSSKYRGFDSLDDFAAYYESQIKNKRYTNQGIMAARDPESFAKSLGNGGWFEGDKRKTREQNNADYAAGIHRFGDGVSVTVQVQNMHNSSPEEVGKAAKAGAEKAINDYVRRSMTELDGAYQ